MTSEKISEEKPKRRINSKKKGNSFEGQIGKILADKLKPLKFRRSQSSGAILGGENTKFLDQFSNDAKCLFVGDVVPTNETDVAREHGWKFKFTLECKFYKSCDNLEHLFNNTKIKGWIEQAISDALKVNKEPLLIFKFNRTDTYCAVPSKNLIPSSVTRTVKVKFSADEFSAANKFDDGIEITIFTLKDALNDVDWWKTTNIL